MPNFRDILLQFLEEEEDVMEGVQVNVYDKFLEEEEDVMEGIQVNVYDKGRHRFKLMLNKMIQVGLVTGELSPVWHTQLTFSCEELTWWQGRDKYLAKEERELLVEHWNWKRLRVEYVIQDLTHQ
ncbi:hypothetical protein JHK87_000759 [Glycine soja]|nr:hypothetical protein JHK87_000759 [Glycine soja]